MTKPASPRSRASWLANFNPAAEALREPTIATIGRNNVPAAPRTARSGGASSSVASRRRITRFLRRDQADAKRLACGEFGAGLLLAANAAVTRGAAAPCQVGQAVQCCSHAAEMGQQRTKGARPDIVGPDQPEAVDPLGIGEFCRVDDGVHRRIPCGDSMKQPGRVGKGAWLRGGRE